MFVICAVYGSMCRPLFLTLLPLCILPVCPFCLCCRPQSAKYLVKAIPFPFTSAEQYEHSLRAPVGADWNTQYTHHQLTKPAVQIKAGHLIAPMTQGAAAAGVHAQRQAAAKEARRTGGGDAAPAKKQQPAGGFAKKRKTT